MIAKRFQRPRTAFGIAAAFADAVFWTGTAMVAAEVPLDLAILSNSETRLTLRVSVDIEIDSQYGAKRENEPVVKSLKATRVELLWPGATAQVGLEEVKRWMQEALLDPGKPVWQEVDRCWHGTPGQPVSAPPQGPSGSNAPSTLRPFLAARHLFDGGDKPSVLSILKPDGEWQFLRTLSEMAPADDTSWPPAVHADNGKSEAFLVVHPPKSPVLGARWLACFSGQRYPARLLWVTNVRSSATVYGSVEDLVGMLRQIEETIGKSPDVFSNGIRWICFGEEGLAFEFGEAGKDAGGYGIWLRRDRPESIRVTRGVGAVPAWVRAHFGPHQDQVPDAGRKDVRTALAAASVCGSGAWGPRPIRSSSRGLSETVLPELPVDPELWAVPAESYVSLK